MFHCASTASSRVKSEAMPRVGNYLVALPMCRDEFDILAGRALARALDAHADRNDDVGAESKAQSIRRVWTVLGEGVARRPLEFDDAAAPA